MVGSASVPCTMSGVAAWGSAGASPGWGSAGATAGVVEGAGEAIVTGIGRSASRVAPSPPSSARSAQPVNPSAATSRTPAAPISGVRRRAGEVIG
jgi:hypothetical protein